MIQILKIPDIKLTVRKVPDEVIHVNVLVYKSVLISDTDFIDK